ncbi:hypothetical protein BpHYR1_002527 [Brachionus plicatilis]|uniref:Uncharacterized protein n=1 Tax=Brachionus plicatilis TaxID=10195 RepID=A0A3M7SQC7_BRAPC|nr:hypothetical protein BpHYR1_002527 [Brachionus plicatilis]
MPRRCLIDFCLSLSAALTFGLAAICLTKLRLLALAKPTALGSLRAGCLSSWGLLLASFVNLSLSDSFVELDSAIFAGGKDVMSKTYTHQDCEKTAPGVNHQNFYKNEIFF